MALLILYTASVTRFVAPFFSLFGYNLRYGVSRFETFTSGCGGRLRYRGLWAGPLGDDQQNSRLKT